LWSSAAIPLSKVQCLLQSHFATGQVSHPTLAFAWTYFFVVTSAFAC
jgi:hypothetical protein